MNLDDSTSFCALDPSGVLGRISELPQQCRTAWVRAQESELPSDYGNIHHIVVTGMGAAAIGGDLLRILVQDECRVPIFVHRDYTLPDWVGSRTLVIGCSYSGNTEETLSAMGEALARGTQPVVVTTGGKLAALALERGVPLVHFDYQSQPQAALGYFFILLLGSLCRLGLVRDYSADLEEAIQVMEKWQAEIGPGVPTVHNAAKSLAGRLVDRLPVIYGAGILAPVARRWKTQINENAKAWASSETLPELSHNAVLGFGIPQAVRERVVVLMLRSKLDHPRIQARWDVTRELLGSEGVMNEMLQGRGDTKLAQMLSLIHFGDYVSYYLAMLYRVDPVPRETVAFLKERLAELD